MIKNRKLILLIVIMMVFITNIQAEEGVGFDWSIPARFGSDTNDDGLIDYKASPNFYELDEEEALSAAQKFINPDTWTINFDACKSGEKFDIAEYQWEIDGKLISKEEECDTFSYKFHDKKTHVVQLTVLDMMGNKTTVQEQVKVKDWLIIGVGDSYGSGEGIPDIPISVDAIEEWQKAQNNLTEARKNLLEASKNLVGANSDLETIQKNVDKLIDLTEDWQAKAIKSGKCKAIALGFPFTIRSWIKEGCIGNNTALTKVTGQIGDALIALSFKVTLNPLNPAGTLKTIINMGNNSIEVAKQSIKTIKARKEQIEASIPALENLVDRYNGKVQPKWQNRQCHQSAFSSQAQAALNIEKADEHSSVTFIHLACSGAELKSGLVEPYDGVEKNDELPLPSQIEQIKKLIGNNREIDALLISAGGNDIGFSSIIQNCIFQGDCVESAEQITSISDLGEFDICDNPLISILSWRGESICSSNIIFNAIKSTLDLSESGASLFERRYDALPDRYDEVQTKIEEELPNLPANRIYITEYPNATQDDSGEYCTQSDSSDALNSIPGFSKKENIWADQVLTQSLNHTIADRAEAHGWNYVTGLYSLSKTHGYCAKDGWFVRLQDSLLEQGTKEGMLHPTKEANHQYGEILAKYLRDDFNKKDELEVEKEAPEVSLIQSNYGIKGNFEMVVQEGDELCHYWRDNDEEGYPWRKTTCFGQNITSAPSLIQSNYGEQGNFEVVVREGSQLAHYWRDNDKEGHPWSKYPTYFGQNITSAPSLIQSNYGEQGNFEVVVREGDQLAHYWRDNDKEGSPWSKYPTYFGQNISSSPSLIQSNYGEQGNFEVVVREGSHLAHYWRDNDKEGSPWSKYPTYFGENISSAPSLIQSNYGEEGNFEVVVLEGDKLCHYVRSNDKEDNSWSNEPICFSRGNFMSAPSLIQSNYGEEGNFEVLVRDGNELDHYSRRNDNEENLWSEPMIMRDNIIVSYGEERSDWSVYDTSPLGATISSIFDEDKGQVIQLSGEGTDNGYIIGDWSGGANVWNNGRDRTIQWSMKYDEDFVVYISVDTQKGHRFLYYDNREADGGWISDVISGHDIDSRYVHYGIGMEASDGTWRMFKRNLEEDLKEVESDNAIVSVNAFLIRGSGLVDDIEMSN